MMHYIYLNRYWYITGALPGDSTGDSTGDSRGDSFSHLKAPWNSTRRRI